MISVCPLKKFKLFADESRYITYAMKSMIKRWYTGLECPYLIHYSPNRPINKQNWLVSVDKKKKKIFRQWRPFVDSLEIALKKKLNFLRA